MQLSALNRICWAGDGCIGLAAADLAKDIYAVSGLSVAVEEGIAPDAGVICVGTTENTAFLAAVEGFFKQLPQ